MKITIVHYSLLGYQGYQAFINNNKIHLFFKKLVWAEEYTKYAEYIEKRIGKNPIIDKFDKKEDCKNVNIEYVVNRLVE
jgi:hypothetical protein